MKLQFCRTLRFVGWMAIILAVITGLQVRAAENSITGLRLATTVHFKIFILTVTGCCSQQDLSL